jgi:hypothetical protein
MNSVPTTPNSAIQQKIHHTLPSLPHSRSYSHTNAYHSHSNMGYPPYYQDQSPSPNTPLGSSPSKNPQTPKNRHIHSNSSTLTKALTPSPPASTLRKIIAFIIGFFAGLIAGIIAGGIVMIITAAYSFPLIVEKNQIGSKKVAQKAIQVLVSGIGTSTAALFCVRTWWNVGRRVHENIIKGQ